MPFTVTITTIKPANSIFYGQASDAHKEIRNNINDWTAKQPGFISKTGQEYIDENTREQTLIWNTEQDYINYNTNRAQLFEQIERKTYNNQNGIVSTITIL